MDLLIVICAFCVVLVAIFIEGFILDEFPGYIDHCFPVTAKLIIQSAFLGYIYYTINIQTYFKFSSLFNDDHNIKLHIEISSVICSLVFFWFLLRYNDYVNKKLGKDNAVSSSPYYMLLSIIVFNVNGKLFVNIFNIFKYHASIVIVTCILPVLIFVNNQHVKNYIIIYIATCLISFTILFLFNYASLYINKNECFVVKNELNIKYRKASEAYGELFDKIKNDAVGFFSKKTSSNQQGTTNIAVNKRTEQPSNYNNPPPVRGNVDMTSDNAEELFTREYKKLYNTDVAKKAFTNFVGPYANQKQGLSQDKYTEILLYTLGHELKRISYLEDCLTAIANNKTGSYTTIYSKAEIDKYINNELIKGDQDSIADFIEYAKSFISRFKFSNTYEFERYLLLTSATMNITYKMMTELVDNIHVFDYSIINQIFSHNDNSTRNMLNKTALSYSKDLVNSFAHTLNI